ncbi:MAG: bifunctional hydroxymethylpyrimidine kinase/phosphomethylpyrimidine kinase [Kiritimatiellae bacterium]|nr:bifunctional hydroxymethylpyrimidine kinase/phosphomethylpyrimidine kinase [Kiritimatiellia bacterium]
MRTSSHASAVLGVGWAVKLDRVRTGVIAEVARFGDSFGMVARPIAWTIAGTDPSGGAGIQADLKVFHSLGVYGGSAITAIVVQNTLGVRSVEPLGAGVVRAQIECLGEDLPPRAVKVGMLATAENVRVVAELLGPLGVPIVVDPVLASSGGAVLLAGGGVEELVQRLLPCTTLLTPNLGEAARLLGREEISAADMPAAAEALLERGPAAVLLKGGHAEWASECRDFFATRAGERRWLVSPRRRVTHTHGTGCTLSSAIAAFLAHGQSLGPAVVLGKAYVNQGLRLGGGIGRGRGPLAHLGWPHDPADLPVEEVWGGGEGQGS